MKRTLLTMELLITTYNQRQFQSRTYRDYKNLFIIIFLHSTQTNRYIQNKKGRGSVFQDCICEGVIAILGFPCLKAFEIVLLLVFRCLHMVRY